MGLFDYINVEINCPICDSVMTNFQSKDDYCVMGTIGPTTVGHFHAMCPICGAWVDFDRPRLPPEVARISPYTADEVKELGFVMTYRNMRNELVKV